MSLAKFLVATSPNLIAVLGTARKKVCVLIAVTVDHSRLAVRHFDMDAKAPPQKPQFGATF